MSGRWLAKFGKLGNRREIESGRKVMHSVASWERLGVSKSGQPLKKPEDSFRRGGVEGDRQVEVAGELVPRRRIYYHWRVYEVIPPFYYLEVGDYNFSFPHI